MTHAVSQGQFLGALVDPACPVPEGLVSPRGTRDDKRFAVYRNNVHVSLVAALAARFPVTRQLVGETFFSGMARLYVTDHKPKSPVLLTYGDEFPAFIQSFPPAARVAYLADMARLEAAWTQSYHAADSAILPAGALAALAPETLGDLRLALAPATRAIASAWPIGSIWSAHQVQPFVAPTVSGPEEIVLTRPDADVRLTVVPRGTVQFLAGLESGQALAEAADTAIGQFPNFDPGAALVGLITIGAFASLEQEADHA